MKAVLLNDHAQSRNRLGHLHYFSRETAIRTLQDTGYEVIDWYYTKSSETERTGGISIKARILNIVRRFTFLFAPELTRKLLGGYSMVVLAKK